MHSTLIKKSLIPLLFILLTLIGVFTIRDYGAPYDEITEMIILGSAVKEYALTLDGEDSTNYYSNMNVQRMRDNIEKDHGICAYYPLVPFFKQMEGNSRFASGIWSLLTWLWFMVGCLSLYGFLREIGLKKWVALSGMLMLYLHPRFFAEGHYNNKDVVLLCLFLLTLFLGARLFSKVTFPRGILFAFAGAMATNTKIVGALPFGLIGIALVVYLFVTKKWEKKIIWVAIITALSYFTFYFFLTPGFWSDPLGFITYLIDNATGFTRFGGTVIFRGAEFYDVAQTTPLPWYYIPFNILVTTPLYTLLLAIIGQLLVIWKAIRSKWKTSTPYLWMVASITYLLPITFSLIDTPLLYNGWRHFYFVYAGIVIIASIGLDFLVEFAQAKRNLRWLPAVAIVACFTFTSVGLIQNRYYQFAYFNPLIPRDAKHYMDMDYWNVGASGAYQELYALNSDEEELRVGCYFNDIKIGAFKIPQPVYEKIVPTVNRDEDYLYYGSTYAYIYKAKEPPEGYSVLFPIKSYGNTIGTVYKKNKQMGISKN